MPDRCAVCGATGHDKVLTLDRWDIVACRVCATHVLDPMPAEVSMEGFDDGSEYASLADLEPAILAEHARTLAALAELRGPGRLLDVGCGTGLFVRAAGGAGWQAQGIDPSETAVAAARSAGLDVRAGLLEDAGFEPASFDAVSLMQVVEHLPEPAPLIGACARLLKPGGVLLIATPNPTSWLARSAKERFNYWIPPTHVAWYPPGALVRLTAAAGLVPAHSRTWSATAPGLHDGMAVLGYLPGVRRLPYRLRRALSGRVARFADARGAGTIVEQFALKP